MKKISALKSAEKSYREMPWEICGNEIKELVDEISDSIKFSADNAMEAMSLCDALLLLAVKANCQRITNELDPSELMEIAKIAFAALDVAMWNTLISKEK